MSAPAPPAPPETVEAEPEPAAPGPKKNTGWSIARSLANGLVLPTLALLTALAVGALVIVFSNSDTLESWGNLFSDPGGALSDSWNLVWESYKALYESSLGNPVARSRTLREATPLLFAGLSVALAFRAGLFNIGGAGQLIAGAMCAGYIGFTLDLPRIIHLPLALIAGFAGGALWGGIAGLLKARTGAHEVITTIMLNFIALRLLDYALSTRAFQREGRTDPISPPTADSAHFPVYNLGQLQVGMGLLLGLATATGVWWLLYRSTLGFRLRAVGANPHAAKYAGMSVGATYVLAMGLAGGLAGLAGTSNIIGLASYSLTPGYYYFIGFDAIALALLGRANPFGVVAAALLIGVLRAGSTGMQAATSTPVDIIIVIQALIIAFVAAPEVIRAIYRVRADRLATGQAFTTNWGSG